MRSYLPTKYCSLLCLLLISICIASISSFPTHPIVFASSYDAYQIITQDLASGKTNIHLPAGSYTVSNAIVIGKPDIQIYGDGENSTILTPSSSFPSSSDSLISFLQANSFSIHDLQITGILSGQTTPTLKNGIIAWESDGGLMKNIYAHDFTTFTLLYEHANGGQILNNLVVNSGSNGISVNDEKGGQGTFVSGNVVDGFSDVGITAWVGKDFTATDNTVRNGMLNVSPFGGNSHWGMASEGDHTVVGAASAGVTYSNNLIINCGIGLVSTPNNNQTSTSVNRNISYLNNTVLDSGAGLVVTDTVGFVAKGNLMTSFRNDAEWGVKIQPYFLSSDLDLENNFVGPLPSDITGAAVEIYGGSGRFTNGYSAVFVNQAAKPHWIISYTAIANSTTTISGSTSTTSITQTTASSSTTGSITTSSFSFVTTTLLNGTGVSSVALATSTGLSSLGTSSFTGTAVIPGFLPESIIIGIVIGLGALMMLRRRRQ